jgi:hypothetical protein
VDPRQTADDGPEVNVVTESPTQTVKSAAGRTRRLLVLLAAAQLVPIGLAVAVNFAGTRIQDQVVGALDRNPEPLGEAAAFVIAAGAALSGLIAVVAAIVLAILASKVSRGVGARVVGALLLLWSVAVTAINPRGGPLTLLAPAADTNNTLSGKEFQDQINEALPGWIQPTQLGFAALTAVLVIAVYVSLSRANPPISGKSI